MGNRIHKTLGYGFPRIKAKNDPRFNRNFIDLLNEENDIKPELIKWCEDRRTDKINEVELFYYWLLGVLWYESDGAPEKLYLSDFIRYSGYIGESKYSPIVFGNYKKDKDWYRYDSIIDYYSYDHCKDEIKYITDECGNVCPIYPSCRYVNRNTGKDVKIPLPKWRTTEILNKAKTVSNPNLGEKWESDYGIKTLSDWKKLIAPKPPIDILAVCEIMDIFKNPLTVYRLKPMIYTYWC